MTALQDLARETTAGFDATVVSYPHHDVVVLRGELDLAAACSFEPPRRPVPVLVDCGGVTFADAAGIRMLLHLLASPGARLVDVSPPVSRLLQLLDLGELADPYGRNAR